MRRVADTCAMHPEGAGFCDRTRVPDPRPEFFPPRCCPIENDPPDSARCPIVTEIKPCSRCSRGFYPSHGNQTVCAGCKAARPTELRAGVTRTFGLRNCALCWREFVAVSENQKFCTRRCLHRARKRDDAKYARPEHRGARARWAPAVASGMVRCHRGAACRRAEWVDGVLTGGIIEPGEPWHLGHADGEALGGPEHRACNTGAPSRLRAKVRRG